MARTKKKQAFNTFYVTDYIRKVIKEEYNAVKEAYSQQFNPFFGWVVGDIFEEDIKTFVIDKFHLFESKRISNSENTHDYLDFSLLAQTIKEKLGMIKLPKQDSNGSQINPDEIFPDHPSAFSMDNWKSIRKRFEDLKKQERDSFGDVLDTWDNAPSNEETNSELLNKERFTDQRKKVNRDLYKRELAREDPNFSPTNFGKQKGTKTFEAKIHDPGFVIDVTTLSKILKGKEIFQVHEFIDYLTTEINELFYTANSSGRLVINLTNPKTLSLHLVYIQKNLSPDLIKTGEASTLNEIEEYLLAKYLDVHVEMKQKSIDNLTFYYLEAFFTLDAKQISETELLFLIRSDNVILSLE